MCQDPYLGYTERYLRVVLEIRRIDVLLVLVFVTLALNTVQHWRIRLYLCARYGSVNCSPLLEQRLLSHYLHQQNKKNQAGYCSGNDCILEMPGSDFGRNTG